MEVVYTEKSREDLQKLPRNIRKVVKEELEKLSSKKLDYRKVGLIKTRKRDYFRLKIRDKDANPQLNHRIIFDIVKKDDENIIQVEIIAHRDDIEYS